MESFFSVANAAAWLLSLLALPNFNIKESVNSANDHGKRRKKGNELISDDNLAL